MFIEGCSGREAVSQYRYGACICGGCGGFALSPPAEMDSIAAPPTPASVDGPTPAIAIRLVPLVNAEDFIEGGRWCGEAMMIGGGERTRQSTLGGRWEGGA